jgi:hypothetical protein
MLDKLGKPEDGSSSLEISEDGSLALGSIGDEEGGLMVVIGIVTAGRGAGAGGISL